MIDLKYDDWDNVQAVSQSSKLPADGYVCKILKTELTQSSSGNEMLLFALDIHEGVYKGFFKEKFEFKKADNPSAKWPCILYQLTRGKSAGYFKSLILNIEKSNPGYSFKASNFDEASLINKLIGIVFREEEWKFNNKTGTSAKPYISKTVDDIRAHKFNVPDPLYLDGSSATSNNSASDIIDSSSKKYDDIDVPF